jgi:hypothetical protein
MKSFVAVGLVAAALVLTPGSARADILATPFIGITFAGDTSGTPITFGGSGMFMARGYGLEIEAAFTPEIFEHGPETDLLTLSANYVAGADLRGRGLKPYGVVGVGLIRTIVGDDHDDQFGLNVGAGLVGLFNPVVGLRGDIRYFRSVQGASDIPIIPLADNFDFWRGSIGVTFRF